MIVSQNDYGCKADDSDGEGKNRPVATNFQFLKILAPLGQLLVGACLPQTLRREIAINGNYQRVMFFLNLAVYASFSSCSLIP